MDAMLFEREAEAMNEADLEHNEHMHELHEEDEFDMRYDEAELAERAAMEDERHCRTAMPKWLARWPLPDATPETLYFDENRFFSPASDFGIDLAFQTKERH